uniref:Putative secreted protein n=1 Tax=Ixodes ricinus TaxID=34613 RepID=A0A6B0UJX3_IXORI
MLVQIGLLKKLFFFLFTYSLTLSSKSEASELIICASMRASMAHIPTKHRRLVFLSLPCHHSYALSASADPLHIPWRLGGSSLSYATFSNDRWELGRKRKEMTEVVTNTSRL